MSLTRRRGGQIVSAHHLVYTTGTVIDDDDEIVGEDAISAFENQIIDRGRDLSQQPVMNCDLSIGGLQPQCRAAPLLLKSLSLTFTFGFGQVPAGSRI